MERGRVCSRRTHIRAKARRNGGGRWCHFDDRLGFDAPTEQARDLGREDYGGDCKGANEDHLPDRFPRQIHQVSPVKCVSRPFLVELVHMHTS